MKKIISKICRRVLAFGKGVYSQNNVTQNYYRLIEQRYKSICLQQHASPGRPGATLG
jgi:hypothetical protein